TFPNDDPNNGSIDGTPLTVYYSNYAGCVGSWVYTPRYSGATATPGAFQASLAQLNGMFYYIGFNPWPTNGQAVAAGGISPVKIASITDGTSNTILFGERAHGKYSKDFYNGGYNDFFDWNWWMSGAYGDTLFTTEFGINPKLGAIQGDFANVGSTYD